MKVSEMLLFPSWAEGLPNVVLEAMASGLPVVTTSVGGIPEVVEDGVTGLLVPPKDADALATAALRIIEDNELRQRCIRNARKLVCERFDVNRNVDWLYNTLLNMVQKNNS
jgi:glycosyltransferase involved in cell wall biosynthesis